MAHNCIEIQQLLPWLANDSLPCEDIKPVLDHLSVCTHCRKELAFIVRMQKAAVNTAETADKRLKSKLFDALVYEIRKDESLEQAETGSSKELLLSIVENPSPLGIMGAVMHEVTNIISVKAAVIKEEFRPVTQSFRILGLLYGVI